MRVRLLGATFISSSIVVLSLVQFFATVHRNRFTGALSWPPFLSRSQPGLP
jgi:hypothetical protein